MFRAIMSVFRKEDRGQDLSEYCLMTALIALVALGIFVHVSGGFQNIWASGNSTLVAGNTAATTNAAGGAGDVPASTPPGSN
jgi:Flp pilus assembly pilin Flp